MEEKIEFYFYTQKKNSLECFNRQFLNYLKGDAFSFDENFLFEIKKKCITRIDLFAKSFDSLNFSHHKVK